MARKPVSDIAAYASLTLEGNLIAPAMIAAIDQREAQEQDASDYGVRKGLNLRDEVSTAFRVGQAHYDAFAKQSDPSSASTTRFVRAFLEETFGFNDISAADAPIAFAAGNGRVPVVIVPPVDALDRASPSLSTERRRSAAFALQDYLNEREEALWGIATNGNTLRVMRDNASLTRPAYIEANIAQIFETDDIASFAVLWLLIHRTRFGKAGSPAPDCALERWRDAGAKEGDVAREKLAAQVEEALKLLGSGFLEANPDLRNRISSGELPLTNWFNELLRLVYRLIFLMVAEDRNLLHTPEASNDARRLYREGYSLAHLRANAIRRTAWDRHHDRYEGLKIIFKALAGGQPLLGLPPLGGIFNGSQLPDLEIARISNRAFLHAIYRLSWLTQDGAMVPVNWRAMETEELGSVYESLLELQPQLSPNGQELLFAQDIGEQRGNQRKTTGSYYTPDSLVQALLDTALDPVLDRAESNSNDPVEALLSLTVIDPACGSGHFLLAAARRIATRVARHRSTGTPSIADFRHALRDASRRCIYGVDRNPMAVELTKVALWIETVDPGLPLGFFDANIRCGDSLFGIFDLNVLEEGIPDEAYKPLAGDDKEIAKSFARQNRNECSGQGLFDFSSGSGKLPPSKHLVDVTTQLRSMNEDTLEHIQTKTQRFAELRKASAWLRLKAACDFYVSAFLAPKIEPAAPSSATLQIPTTSNVWHALSGTAVNDVLTAKAQELASDARAFHWPLEFPDIIAAGGFDVVLGNPPWEVMQLSDKEYFALRSPDIASLTGAKRKIAIGALRASNPREFAEYETMKRLSAVANEFARASKRFELTAKGKVNTFALFAELSLRLIRRRGRAGNILPAEILTSETLSEFLHHLVSKAMLESAFSFENEEFVFPGIANVVRFCLLTMTKERSASEVVRMAHYLRRVEHLADPERIVDLRPNDFATFSPNLGTSPVLRSQADFVLAKRLFTNIPSLAIDRSSKADSWIVDAKQGLFNMASDSGAFNESAALISRGLVLSTARVFKSKTETFLPLYEGKFISHFDHRFSSYHNLGKEKGRGGRGLPPVKIEEYEDETFEILPRYWVDANTVIDKLSEFNWNRNWMLGWRDIANAKVERTVTMAAIPVSAVGDTCSILFPHHEPRLAACLFANLNSLVLDYLARQIVGGTHITYGYLKQLPVLPPSYYTEDRRSFVVSRTLELTYTSKALSSFANDLEYNGPPFKWNESRRAALKAELDAFFARAYGITRNELSYVLDPAEVKGPDYPSETFRVLKEREIRQFGEYRTGSLTFAAWDKMETEGIFTSMGL